MTPSERALWLAREYSDALAHNGTEAQACMTLASNLEDAVASNTAKRAQVIAGALIVARSQVRAALKDSHEIDLAAARAGIVAEIRRAVGSSLDAVGKRVGK